MPRKIHALSQQTKDTLTDNVKAFARTWDCGTDYINKILSEDRTDFYPPFREAYVALLDAGISTAEYDADLEFERERRAAKMPAKELAATIHQKFNQQNRTLDKYLTAVEDGEWTEAELNEIEGLLLSERDAIDHAVRSIKTKLEQIGQGKKLRPVG